ncbi:disintegrin and metalloproteinase domain-containing protein 1a-like, partial [Echinops telfairi]|uniref:Disintegrin and metalloproteinase domain-containing protein 1a-like n=1 Tax=Echinops telfairi TaxID=9371 RepID=A0ABM1VLU4_ECHTE
VIPQRMALEGREDSVGEASYMLYMQGLKQVIHLKVKKDYFVSNFPVFSYHNGTVGQETPLVSHDCHYEGYIEGAPGSFVSVNTCSGLKGVLIKGARSYGIEPLESSQCFEHVLHAMAPHAPVSCSVPSAEGLGVPTSRKPPKLQAPSSLWSHTKYVEMFVVVNHQRFQMWGSNVHETVLGVMDIVALANSFTRALNTQVVLAGMEIWNEGDLMEVPGDLEGTLRNFNSWRRQKLLGRVKHDVAHMIVGHHPGQIMGQAYLSGACSSGFAAAVASFHHEDVFLFAALMVHELGHNLGIEHDHPACICKEKYFCLMHANITKESGFSDCSSYSFYQFLHEHKGMCLFNKPRHRVRTRRNAVCGNGVREASEECDCGPNCDSNPCCDVTCRLKPGAQCNGRLCCADCLHRRKGYICRSAQDECDLPEYCHGDSGECPADTYKQDGTPCQRINYCYRGRCMNPDEHCRTLYGISARSASEDCYQLMNSKGNRFGNCGRPTNTDPVYIKCIDEDIFCGKLICTDVVVIPSIKPQHTLIQIPFKDDWCWSMDAYTSTDIPDEGDVQPGTYCAPNKVCMNYSCVDHTVLNYNCEPATMCNGKGVCNNLRHCHCEPGFAPPDCKRQGEGGSVDSGPVNVLNFEQSSEGSTHLRSQQRGDLGKLVFILPVFLIVFFLGLVIFTLLSRKGKPTEATPVTPPEAPPEEPPGAPPEEEPQRAEESAPEDEHVMETEPE